MSSICIKKPAVLWWVLKFVQPQNACREFYPEAYLGVAYARRWIHGPPATGTATLLTYISTPQILADYIATLWCYPIGPPAVISSKVTITVP